jgi:hypothetical protein
MNCSVSLTCCNALLKCLLLGFVPKDEPGLMPSPHHLARTLKKATVAVFTPYVRPPAGWQANGADSEGRSRKRAAFRFPIN